MKTLKLDKKVTIPILGFGTYKLQGKYCQEAVECALITGYRHIDTAQYYNNHHEIKLALNHSPLKRKELFITSKIWPDNLDKTKVITSIEKILDELGMEYLDLCLIHWPSPIVPIEETLEEFLIAQQKGLIKTYGVSNFTIRHLKDCRKKGFQIPINQVEFHPSFNQKDLKEFCDFYKIVITAYSPLGKGSDVNLPLIVELSKKYQRPAAQVIINWLMEKDIVTIPKAQNPKHIIENFQSLEWSLSKTDVTRIDELNDQKRMTNPSYAQFDK